MRVKYLLKSVPFYGALLGMVAIYLGDDYFKVHLAQLDMGFLIAILLLCIWILFKAAGAGNEFKWLNNAPSIITTVGIFCTFVGVTIGLLGYNPANPDLSNLLAGLKIAFIPSAYAIFCSIFFKWSAISIEPDDEQVLSQLILSISQRLDDLKTELKHTILDNGVQQLNSNNIEIPPDVTNLLKVLETLKTKIDVKFNLSCNGKEITIDQLEKLQDKKDIDINVNAPGLTESFVSEINKLQNKEVNVSVSGVTESIVKDINLLSNKTVQITIDDKDYKDNIAELNKLANKSVIVVDSDKVQEELTKVLTNNLSGTLTQAQLMERVGNILNTNINATLTQDELTNQFKTLLSAKITGELDLDDAKKTFESYLTNKAGFANPDSYLATISENLDALKLMWVNNNG